jgi:hypothetical protein
VATHSRRTIDKNFTEVFSLYFFLLVLYVIVSLGAPLAETDLKPMDDLGKEIRMWILEKSKSSTTPGTKSGTVMAAAAVNNAAGDASPSTREDQVRSATHSSAKLTGSSTGHTTTYNRGGGGGIGDKPSSNGGDDDLYDF